MKSREVGRPSRSIESGPMVAGIILAAGASSRMGRSKALLPHPVTGRPLVRELIEVFKAGGTEDVIVITRSGDETVANECRAAGAATAINPDPSQGQLASLLIGLEAAEAVGARGVLVSPVDLPLVSAAVVRRVLAETHRRFAIVRPTHGGRSGHPVYFDRVIFTELRQADPTLGARSVVRADPSRVLDVEVDDAGILTDVDTPEEYERLRERRPL